MGVSRIIVGLLCLTAAGAFENKSVYQYLVDNGYSVLATMMKSAGLDMELDGAGPFTVFAPTDSAFSRLDPTYLASLSSIQVKRMVNYHVLNGFQLLPQLKSVRLVSSKEGHDIHLSTNGASVVLNNASTIALTNDIICNNGVVQPINNVLIPPLFNSTNIAGKLVTRDDKFRISFLYFYFANLTTTLEAGEYTVFAPVDAAWAPYVDEIRHPYNITNSFAIHSFLEMMKYHIVPGARTSDMLKNGDKLFTLHGYPLNVTVTGSETMVNDAELLEKDIFASNGVIHAVNKVMYPHDLYLEFLQLTNQPTAPP